MYEMTKELIMSKCPTSMCHASTLLKLKDGSVLCAWFGGSKEGNDDVNIWLSKRTNDTWSEPVEITSEPETHWNPVFFELTEERIILFYKIGKEIKKWRTMVTYSNDGGLTWERPVEMVEGDKGGRGPVRNKPIRLQNGRILAPASLENGIWSAFVDISDDNGKTWTKSQDVVIENVIGSTTERTVDKGDSNIPVSEQSFYGRGVIQPTLWESGNGNVHMFLRSTEGKIYRSDSKDFGNTWCNAYPTELPNNNSGIDLVSLKDGRLLLVYNPVGKNWGPRTPISLALSDNNGESFRKLGDLDSDEGEFAYPAIIADDENAYISYTYKRENVAFWLISLI